MKSGKRLTKSFGFALRGLWSVFKSQQNFRIHCAAAVVILVLVLFLQLKSWEIGLVSVAVIFVLVCELLNSVLERLVDLLEPKIHGNVKFIKDVSAGIVLLASLLAVIIGCLVFLPYFI